MTTTTHTTLHGGAFRIGVDIGGTKTHAIVLDPAGAIAQEVTLPTGFGMDAVIATAVAALEGLSEASGIALDEFASIGVGIPGAVDPARGRVSHALNLGLEHLDLGREIADRIGVSVRIENDVNAAALGAFHALRLPATASMGYLNLGTGLAAGLVLHGKLWRGSRGAAGEIGHILVDPHGPLDLDGQPGGLEVMASGSGIARQWLGGNDTSVSEVCSAADAGDPKAREIRSRLFDGVASSIRILVLTLDVDIVVIGGGISALGELLTDGVDAVFRTWDESSPFIASLELGSRVRLVPHGVPVAALGAALLGDVLEASIFQEVV
ncbi:MAG: ROK family protein [Microbacteriaceae bacterium]